ncbi:MAG: leucyl aminopeptidase [Desulforhopalus sp.]|jgi:leucyl aminopeptidase
MNLPKIVVSNKKSSEFIGDMVVAFVSLDKKEKFICDDAVTHIVKQFTETADFKAKSDEQVLLYAPFSSEKKSLQVSRLLLLGLGQKSGKIKRVPLYEELRIAGGNIANVAKKNKLSEIGIWLPKIDGIDETIIARYVIEGIGLGGYAFTSYKKKEKDEYKGLKKITIIGAADQRSVRKAVQFGGNSVSATNVARDMANEPGNHWTPSKFAGFAEDLATQYSLNCTIIEKNEMVELGMGGILAVNQGSHEDPKLVILDYSPENPEKTVMLVGKGLTFDSGGISLKPAQGMMDMKYDMCGGAAVLAAMEAVAKERPSVRVICIVPSTDNMNGGGAIKPGDVITHYGGVTAEIENTDAEGRLILADALAYGIETYRPDYVVDLATLTGAVVIALGHHYTGILSNSRTLAKALIQAGHVSGEPVWQLPLDESFAKQIKSEVADIKNTGGRPGGTITAAEYLHTFVGKTPWAHLDIAGTAWDFTTKSYIPKGPSGTGVRTLIEYIRKLSS